MRARTWPRRSGERPSLRPPARTGRGPHGPEHLSPAGLHFLRGRDADGRLRELEATTRAGRLALGRLAAALIAGRSHERLGYRSLGDYAREHLGVDARALREWARVSVRLEALPQLREALVAGEIGFSAARVVTRLATPETEAACLASIRGRTLRAVEAIAAAVKAAQDAGAPAPVGDRGDTAPAAAPGEGDRVRVCVACTPREARHWAVAVELVRRVAGEALPVWRCAEAMAAEVASALGSTTAGGARAAAGAARRARPAARPPPPEEHGLREAAFPRLSWRPRSAHLPPPIARLTRGIPACSARELDRRLRASVAFLQGVDLEIGRILRQMLDRGLFAELGFGGLDPYVRERLDLSPTTARRLVAIARAEPRAPAVASAFRAGRIHAFQARALARVADLDSAAPWVARARAVTLRRLEDDLELLAMGGAAPPGLPPPRGLARGRRAVVFRAPREVAALFLRVLARAGSLDRLLAHAIATWAELGRRGRDPADFERDGWRCSVPGCTARRNLHSHHIAFRSAGGPDAAWNRTTLCAQHHLRGVHGGSVRVRGRAPDALVFELGVGTGAAPAERFASGDVRLETL